MPDFLGNPGALMETVQSSLFAGLDAFIRLLPNLIWAIALIFIGSALGNLVAGMLRRLFQQSKFEKFLESHKVGDALGDVKMTEVLVQLTKYGVILVFLQLAVAALSLGEFTNFLKEVVWYMPKLIGATLAVMAAALVGTFLKEKVLEVHEKETYMRLIANGIRYLVLFWGVIIGLETLGFNTAIVTQSYTILLWGFAFGTALAIGLSFGLGGQETAKDWIKEWRKRLHV